MTEGKGKQFWESEAEAALIGWPVARTWAACCIAEVIAATEVPPPPPTVTVDEVDWGLLMSRVEVVVVADDPPTTPMAKAEGEALPPP